MFEPDDRFRCKVFLRKVGEVAREKGLGTHPFGRVPCVGEYVSLGDKGPHLRVTHVHHTAFEGSSHAAELYCVEADMVMHGEVHPPAFTGW